MNPSILFANSTIAAKEKVKFDNSFVRKLAASPSLEELSKILFSFGYPIDNLEVAASKRLAQILATFKQLCPSDNLKRFVWLATKRRDTAPLRAELKEIPQDWLEYIEDYFGKGVYSAPKARISNCFKLEAFANWFVTKLEEVRVVKIILMAKRLGMNKEQLSLLLRGAK